MSTNKYQKVQQHKGQKRPRDELEESEHESTSDTLDAKKHKSVENNLSEVQLVRFPDKYEKSIFMAGEREIHFNAHVDGETITRLKKLISIIIDKQKEKLVKYDDNKKVPENREKDPVVNITYIVSSPGGSVHDVLDFVDYIEFLRTIYFNIRFTSIITGMVASAGTIMCVIADKRHMTRFAFAMVHELTTGVSRTNYTRIMTHAKFIQDVHDGLVTIYQESRNMSLEDNSKTKELEELLIKESWMKAEQYKKLGFVDEIIGGQHIQRRPNY